MTNQRGGGPPPPPGRSRRIQDIVALGLLAVGVFGFVATAWAWDARAGLASAFAFLICLGVYVGAE